MDLENKQGVAKGRYYSTMKKTISILLVATVCIGCTSVQQLSNDQYKISVKSGLLDNIDSLKAKVRDKAVKLCPSKEFKFVKNWMGDDFAYKVDTYYGAATDHTVTTAIATIKCLPMTNAQVNG